MLAASDARGAGGAPPMLAVALIALGDGAGPEGAFLGAGGGDGPDQRQRQLALAEIVADILAGGAADALIVQQVIGDLKGEPDWETQRADRTYPAPPQDHTGHTWQHSDAVLFDYIRDGGKRFERRAFKSTMDGFGDVMTSAEIWAVVTYLKSCWPKEFRAKQARANFLGGLHNH